MTDEERNRAIDFIVDQQAKNSVRIERLIEAHEKAEHRLDRDEYKLDRLERILKLMIRAGRRERTGGAGCDAARKVSPSCTDFGCNCRDRREDAACTRGSVA